ncbi:MAG: hypothetical protein AB4426_19230 [Xenococcaceae cyanobacterium]
MKCRNFLIIIFLVMAMTCSPSSACTTPPKQAIPKKQSQIYPSAEQKIVIETFADRQIINKDEDINIKVWITPEGMDIDRADVTIFYAENYLTPVYSEEEKDKLKLEKGKLTMEEVCYPSEFPANFTFTGVSTGKYNLNIEVSAKDIKTTNQITTKQKIKDLEVKESEFWFWKLLPLAGTILGTILGAILAYKLTLLNESKEQNKEQEKSKKWIVDVLPTKLAADRLAVEQEKEAEQFESWFNKLLEGYYTKIEDLVARQEQIQRKLAEITWTIGWVRAPVRQAVKIKAVQFISSRPQSNLAEQLLKTGFQLREYHKRLAKKIVTPALKDEIVGNMKYISEKLKQCK